MKRLTKNKIPFTNWLIKLALYMLRQGDDIAAYKEKELRKIYNDGYTIKKAYKKIVDN